MNVRDVPLAHKPPKHSRPPNPERGLWMTRQLHTTVRLLATLALLLLSHAPAQAQIKSGDDIDPMDAKFWGNANNSSVFQLSYGMDGTGKIALINTRVYYANSALNAKHDSDGTNQYNHFHLWDTNSNTYTAANLKLANKYWDAVFGVDALTGNGKLDGDVVSRVQDADLIQDCSAYSFSYTTCTSVWGYALGNDQFKSATTAITDKVADLTKVQAKDIIFYDNGTNNLGMHYTVVDTVQKDKADGMKPEKLRWKFMVSGIYVLTRTKNFFNTPMWSASGAVNTWKELPAGAGDSTQMNSLRRKK
jgi:hypothetical protein